MLQTIGLLKNSLLLIDMTESDKVGIIDSSGDYEDEIVKKSLSKKSNKTTGYLISKARLAFT